MSDYTRSPWGYPGGAQDLSASPNSPHVRVVTDSASDILPSHAQAIGAIVVPSWIVMDGAVYRDGVDISASQFYARLPHLRTPPHTEPASPQEFYRTYQTAFRRGATAVVSIHVSSRLSKIVEHTMIARDHMPDATIDIIDSLQAGIGMWPAVIRAAQLARMGAPASVIHETVISILARTRLYALVESLEQLRRTGRIGRAREWLGTLLDTHPIITVEHGEVTPVETVRTRARGLVRLRELVEAAGALETLLICGASIESIGQLETILAEHYRGIIQKTWLGPAIGSNTGPCVAVALVARQ
jgi:fatty acid kinase fatty acid binding subunit